MLIVEGRPERRECIAEALRGHGHQPVSVASAEEALRAARDGRFEAAWVGDACADDDELDALGESLRGAALLVPGTSGEIELAGGGVREHDALLAELADAVAAARVRAEGVAEEEGPTGPFAGIIGASRAIRELLQLVGKVADTDSTVLVTGETGTGKELIGRAIHQASRRRSRVFCAVNSAAFPETLLESELFGHRRGSFTGASAHKKGLFEHADQGTVFLDEVAEMPLSMQAKLLRFLQTGEVRAVGSESPRYVDVRLVTATNKDLEEEVAAGRFREDLYYRLAVIPIHVPPLRERREDVPVLARHFLRRFARKMGKPVEGIDPAAMELLAEYGWPGNVRQLENTIESGVALCPGRVLAARDLPSRFRSRLPESPSGSLQSLEMLERTHILRTLEQVGWNRKRAAEILQISTTTLWRRLKEFGIERHGVPMGRA